MLLPAAVELNVTVVIVRVQQRSSMVAVSGSMMDSPLVQQTFSSVHLTPTAIVGNKTGGSGTHLSHPRTLHQTSEQSMLF